MDNNPTQTLPADTKVIKTNGSWRIPIEAIIDLKAQNFSNSEIAQRLNCHPSNITGRLQAIERTKQYVKNRVFILQDLQRKLLNHLTDGKLKKANPQQLVWAYGVIYDKERLETGQSTQNIVYADMIKAKESIKSERQKLIEEKGWIDAEFKEL